MAQIGAPVVPTVVASEKIASDKQLAQLDKEKTQHLARLEAGHKAGTMRKGVCEARKADIEQNYDAKTRAGAGAPTADGEEAYAMQTQMLSACCSSTTGWLA